MTAHRPGVAAGVVIADERDINAGKSKTTEEKGVLAVNADRGRSNEAGIIAMLAKSTGVDSELRYASVESELRRTRFTNGRRECSLFSGNSNATNSRIFSLKRNTIYFTVLYISCR